MELLTYTVVPLLGLLVASLGIALWAYRKTRKMGASALAGGVLIPGLWLADGIYWLNNMAVDDPPPGGIIGGYAIGTPIALLICWAACFAALRLFAKD